MARVVLVALLALLLSPERPSATGASGAPVELGPALLVEGAPPGPGFTRARAAPRRARFRLEIPRAHFRDRIATSAGAL